MILYPASASSYPKTLPQIQPGQRWKMLPGGSVYTIVEVRQEVVSCGHSSHPNVQSRVRIYYDQMPAWEEQGWFWSCSFRYRES